jgi:nitrite reductase (NADH) small subunit/3-phenylpropionate/trans-cinnamate dioxygenase ferredoxin subunit
LTVLVPAGRVGEISEDTCVAVGDGTAVVVRVGDTVKAFRNRCLHQDSPLDGAWVRDGVLSCPLHFWRYRVSDGTNIGTAVRLDEFAVRIIDGEAVVEVPDPPDVRTLREQLLDRARAYDRDAAWQARMEQP